jgi:hypothetical protein
LGSEAVEMSYSRKASPVVDPDLSPQTRRWLKRLVERAAHHADRMLIEYAGPLALAFCLLGWLVSGLAEPWLWAAAVAGVVTLAVRHEVKSGALTRHKDRFVDPSLLDSACRRPLLAVQRAIDDVLMSEVYRAGMLDRAACAVDLRRHEWEIACRLRAITKLSAEHAHSMSAGVPGPRTAAVLNAQHRAIEIAQEAAARRVEELAKYAAEVKAADAALRDWRTAEQVANMNDRYLDLVASSEADKHAVAEIIRLAGQAIHTRNVFQVTLQQAMLAAEPLVLPDRERCEPTEMLKET